MLTKSSTILHFCLILVQLQIHNCIEKDTYKGLWYTLSQLHFTLTSTGQHIPCFLNMINKKEMNEDLKESSEHHPWNINWRFRGERWQEINFVTLNRRERKEKPWHRQPNTKHQESLQQLSRREDIHMVQAARNINSENCIWQRQFLNS